MEVNVLYQFNEKYVPYAGVSVTSVLANNRDTSVNIIILGEGLSEGSVKMLRDLAGEYGANIVFPGTASLLERFKTLGMIPYRGAYSVYLRLFFTELEELSGFTGRRILYLDADTVVDRSLVPLMEYDLKSKSAGMVLESIRDDYKVMIGMNPDSDYYNSGVILYDVDKWIQNRYCERLVDHIRNKRSSYIGDQDFLNIVCSGDVCRLPVTYNFQPLHARYSAKQYFAVYGTASDDANGYYQAGEIEEAANGAVISHCYRWLGEFPWNKGNLHPFNDIFDKYLRMSPWREYNKDKANTGAVIRIEKVLYRILPKPLFIRVFRWAHEKMLKRAESDSRMQKVNSRA